MYWCNRRTVAVAPAMTYSSPYDSPFDVVDCGSQRNFPKLSVPYSRSDGEPSECLVTEFTVSQINRWL